jgi:hypothetical protein
VSHNPTLASTRSAEHYAMVVVVLGADAL